MNIDHLATIYKSLSDPTRIKICHYLHKNGESLCSKILKEFQLAQPTMSHHFSKLIESGIVIKRKKQLNNYYSLNMKILNMVGLKLGRLEE